MFSSSNFRRLQLWSDAHGKDFAVRLSNESDFRVVSNPAAKYTKLVEEAEYFENMDYDWKYLLEHWAGVKNGSIRLLDTGNEKEQPAKINWIDLPDDASINNCKKKRVKRTKAKPLLKCHYCMLSYNSEKERSEHEVLWHAEKK
ncbi:MAG: hypothetical protein ABI347_01575 [Nitrososphaera sp.]